MKRDGPGGTEPRVPGMAGQASALAELQGARRRRRLADVDWFDAFYQAYLTGLGVAVAAIVASGFVPDQQVDAPTAAQVARQGPALVGLGVAVVVTLGLRSGARGGPLALEPPTVQHVLLAPVDRATALRRTAIRQLRFAAFAGAVAGALVGLLGARRLPVDAYLAVIMAAAAGSLIALAAVGAALMASGWRWSMRRADLTGALVVAAAGLDAVATTAWSPTTHLGQLALGSLDLPPVALVGAIAALGLAAAGAAAVGGISLEAARRRAGLVAELRFAVTLQDLRTVILLRRRLAQERSRTRPWLPVPRRRRGRVPVWRRDWHSIARFPAVRLARMVVLGGVAGAALVGVWAGTSTLLVVAGLALYVAALDAVEPLAQEVDHPDRWASFPSAPGALLVRHLPAPAVVMALVGLAAAATAGALGSPPLVVPLGATLLAPVAVTAVVAAAASTAQGRTRLKDSTLAFPEAAGMALLTRNLWPPALVIVSLAPVLAARAAAGRGLAPAPAAAGFAVLSLVLTAAALAWLWRRTPDRG